MSVGVTSDECKVELLDLLVQTSIWSGAEMLLSEADITPDRETVLADLTADEVSVAGYARQAVVFSGVPALTAGVALDEADEVTFANTGVTDSPIIYTWGIVSGDGTKLLEAGRWVSPFVLEAVVGEFPTIPRVRLRGE